MKFKKGYRKSYRKSSKRTRPELTQQFFEMLAVAQTDHEKDLLIKTYNVIK